MKPFRYRIVVEWSDEDGAFIARVPALLGCAAHGKTADEATREARRAAEAMLAVLREDGAPSPPEDITTISQVRSVFGCRDRCTSDLPGWRRLREYR